MSVFAKERNSQPIPIWMMILALLFILSQQVLIFAQIENTHFFNRGIGLIDSDARLRGSIVTLKNTLDQVEKLKHQMDEFNDVISKIHSRKNPDRLYLKKLRYVRSELKYLKPDHNRLVERYNYEWELTFMEIKFQLSNFSPETLNHFYKLPDELAIIK